MSLVQVRPGKVMEVRVGDSITIGSATVTVQRKDSPRHCALAIKNKGLTLYANLLDYKYVRVGDATVRLERKGGNTIARLRIIADRDILIARESVCPVLAP